MAASLMSLLPFIAIQDPTLAAQIAAVAGPAPPPAGNLAPPIGQSVPPTQGPLNQLVPPAGPQAPSPGPVSPPVQLPPAAPNLDNVLDDLGLNEGPEPGPAGPSFPEKLGSLAKALAATKRPERQPQARGQRPPQGRGTGLPQGDSQALKTLQSALVPGAGTGIPSLGSLIRRG